VIDYGILIRKDGKRGFINTKGEEVIECKFDDAYKSVEATRTQVTQLAGSYAIRNLNSAGDIINGTTNILKGRLKVIVSPQIIEE